jgi:hypothetical protein
MTLLGSLQSKTMNNIDVPVHVGLETVVSLLIFVSCDGDGVCAIPDGLFSSTSSERH